MWINDVKKFECATEDSKGNHCPNVAEYLVTNMMRDVIEPFKLCIQCKVNLEFKESHRNHKSYIYQTPICNHSLNEEGYCKICGKDFK